MSVIMQVRKVCDELSVLVEDGMWLERRHYAVVKYALRDHPIILNAEWFGDWVKIHQDNLIRTIDEPTPTKFAAEFEARESRNRLRRAKAWVR